MKIVVNPSEQILERGKDFELDQLDEKEVFLLNPSHTMAILIELPFKPIYYIGTTSFRYGRINREVYYSLKTEGPFYSGEYLKTALKILGKKRVRFFLHRKPEGDPNYTVLLLGTKEGTVAIAPRVQLREKKIFEVKRKLLEILKSPTKRFKRALVYAGI